MHRYGESDFDKSYLRWGFHDEDTLAREAGSLLRIVGGDRPLRILDLACGTGAHAVFWAKQGHKVTGVDLSETFIAMANERMLKEGASVEFIRSDIRDFNYDGAYDVVTWIEGSFFEDDIVQRVYRSLTTGGYFVLDVRNPENPKAKFVEGDWRTWREENGVFTLERHETDVQTGVREDAWITIDPQSDLIEEKVISEQRPLTPDQKMQVMKDAGFDTVQLFTMEGEPYNAVEEPYWLWLVGRR